MTRLLESAVEVVRALPADRQDQLARMLLQFAEEDRRIVELDEAEAASFDESLGQAERGEFASEDRIHAIWAKHGL